jgi:hypothetical protein
MDARGYQFSKLPDRQKENELSGENLGLTLKINKWEFLDGNSMQQNDIYNIPLPRGPGPKNQKQKGNERGINYPCGLKKRRILHGDTKYLLGTVV